jgi:hypothetical protein
MKRLLGLLVCIGLFLSACAPGIRGTSSFDPIFAYGLDEVEITAGPEWFMSTDGPINLLTRAERDTTLDGLISPGEYYAGNNRSLPVNWFKLKDYQAPSGWVVAIAGQKATRHVTKTDAVYYYYRDTASITWMIKAPPATPVGSYPIMITVANRDRTGDSAPLFLTIKITVPTPSVQ